MPAMKLIDYMRTTPATDADMAKRLGLSVHGFRKIKYGDRQPTLRMALLIEHVTDGQVTLRDLVKDEVAA